MNNTVKHQVMDEIQNHSAVFKKVNRIQFIIRCPICGDSQSDPRDAHCYIKCDFNNPTEPLLFNCFKCNESGRVTSAFLKKLGIKSDVVSMIDNQRFNKIGSIKHRDIDLVTGKPDMNSLQVKYIESRLGKGFTVDDYEKFKIIWDINSIIPYVTSTRVKNTLPSNNDSISFISDDKSVLATRTFTDEGSRWRKLTIFPSENKSFYTIKTTFNLFTQDSIVVNIAEGILDVLSIYKNFNDGDNSVYVATLGLDYIGAVEYIIAKGIIGKNVIVKVYIDNDKNVDERIIKSQMKKYKWLFGSILLYKNIKSKDVGVTIDQIKLVEQTI